MHFMSDPNYLDPSNPGYPSFIYGQNALSVFEIARSMDGDSPRGKEPLSNLARDAILTAIRFSREEDEPTDYIDVNLATLGLLALLEDSSDS
jgi:hypothetical protein